MLCGSSFGSAGRFSVGRLIDGRLGTESFGPLGSDGSLRFGFSAFGGAGAAGSGSTGSSLSGSAGTNAGTSIVS